MKSNSNIREAGRQALSGKWGMFVLITLLSYIVELFAQVPSNIASYVTHFSVFLAGIFYLLSFVLVLLVINYSWGVTVLYLRSIRKEEIDFVNIFDGYKNGFGKILFTLLLQIIYTFLWTLLLIIPGIIKSLSYSMTSYILLDYPEISGDKAIELSMKMMNGHKAKLFGLYLSFIGWAILCLFTLGVGFLFLTPYVYSSLAIFYKEVKEEYKSDLKEQFDTITQ